MLPGGSTNVVCRTLGIPNDVVDATEHLLAALDDWAPRSAHAIAQAIWGNVAVTQAFLTLSEVIGHADLLVNEGRVREVEDGKVVRYETTG